MRQLCAAKVNTRLAHDDPPRATASWPCPAALPLARRHGTAPANGAPARHIRAESLPRIVSPPPHSGQKPHISPSPARKPRPFRASLAQRVPKRMFRAVGQFPPRVRANAPRRMGGPATTCLCLSGPQPCAAGPETLCFRNRTGFPPFRHISRHFRRNPGAN